MNKKNSIGRLAVTFLILLVVFILVFVFRSKQRTSSFDTQLFTLDASQIHRMEIEAPKQEHPIVLEKDSVWMARSGESSGKAYEYVIESILSEIGEMKASRILSRKEEQWERYKITDSLSRRVRLYNARNRELADFYVGGLLFSQKQSDPNSGFPEMQAITPVRKAGKSTVYAVEGYFSMTLDRGYPDFRDQLIIHQNHINFDKLSYESPGQSYGFEKEGQHWYLDGNRLDSTRITDYLRGFKNMKSAAFADDFMSSDPPVYRIQVFRSDSLLAQVLAWNLDADTLVLTSDMNKGTYFKMHVNEWHSRLFPAADTLLAY